MNKLIAMGVALLFAAAAIPSVEAHSHNTQHVNYFPSLLIVGISCSGDSHTWIPKDPTNPNPDNPLGWAFSGEPECAPSDLMNEAQGTNNPSGFGAGAFYVEPTGRGGSDTFALANTDDAFFGVGESFITLRSPVSESTQEANSDEGCGPRFVSIPSDGEAHWQSTPEDPYYLVWAFIPEVGVTDDLDVCFASVGTVTATIG